MGGAIMRVQTRNRQSAEDAKREKNLWYVNGVCGALAVS
jgi:hypothetical protein